MTARPDRGFAVVAGLVGVAAVGARLPALGTWWCLDDWGQLGRAAGLLAAPEGMPARWLSQYAWWSLTWPLLGADAAAHAWARILLHALAAVTVARIALRAGLPPSAQVMAGLLFAATPIAFTPLYWASGIQELLGGVLALLAVERWMSGGNSGVLAAGALGAGAMLAKESALGLPVLFAAVLVLSQRATVDRSRLAWGVVAVLGTLAVGEGLLVSRHFATGPGDPYAVGGTLVLLGNLGKFGWWLPTPGPFPTAQVTWTKAAIGLVVLALWGLSGAFVWRRGHRLPLAAWASALLSLAPVLPLVNQARPYMGYLAAAAGAIAVASLWRTRSRPGAVTLVALALATVLWGQVTMRGRLAAVGTDGLPADDVVRSAQWARESAAALNAQLPAGFAAEERPLVIFQPRLSGDVADDSVVKTPRYTALAGAVGARLSLDAAVDTRWSASLLDVPARALVVCEKSGGFQAWGTTRDALLYAAELHLAAGRFEACAAHLMRAAALDGTRGLRAPDRDVLGLPSAALGTRIGEFWRWLDDSVGRGEIPLEAARQMKGFPDRR